ncbi:DUF4337 domain-containing protein [Roseomonas eburnea]|uniref:DUF4337 domain-containing protein n=1 Tax=Neoroseomonas eburnea TaxID=1346889 RepID=A0A9X9XJ78_9PROT|nr:DUF4337 domain-containing protein [Neoroseomonas eburnea]MBR0683764.1 DUF4337 domain-containing protein [Neoroseomonas eburnea]
MAGGAHVDTGSNKGVALLIAILALFLALAETGAKSAQTEAISRNIEAANLWAFFQARTIRQTTVRTAAEQAEIALPGLPEEARATAAQRQEAWRGQAARWESEPETGEGRRELMARARAAEDKRDRSLAAYHQYEIGSAAFQVGIVLASASVITGVALLAFAGGLLGVIGVGFAALGFFAPTLVHL